MPVNERTLTTQLTAQLGAYAGAKVIKHADNFTLGVPDLSWTRAGRTWWIEDKYVRAHSTLGQELKDVQLATLIELEPAAIVVEWRLPKKKDAGSKATYVWRPAFLRNIGCHAGSGLKHVEPAVQLVGEASPRELAECVARDGGVGTAGFSHAFVVGVVAGLEEWYGW